MTVEQMIHRAKQAETLDKRLAEVELERESNGFYEEALEARRLRLEQQGAAMYWRNRANGAAP